MAGINVVSTALNSISPIYFGLALCIVLMFNKVYFLPHLVCLVVFAYFRSANYFYLRFLIVCIMRFMWNLELRL